MNPLRYLEKRIRGWLPKGSPRQIPQRTRMVHISQRARALSTRAIGAIATTSVVSSIFLLFVPYYLFPQAYIKKANSAWGYTSPNTLAAWAVLAVALALLVFSTLAFTWLGLRLKLEGSRWATRPWFTPRARTEREKRAFKMSGISNAIMLSAFLGIHFFINPDVWTINLTAISWIIFTFSLISVNFLLYRYSKRQPNGRPETMNLKYLEKRIRGWLPKEPHSSGSQRIANHESTRIRLQIGIVAFIMGFAGGLLGAFGLFSGFGMCALLILICVVLSIAAAAIVIRKKENGERQRMNREVES